MQSLENQPSTEFLELPPIHSTANSISLKGQHQTKKRIIAQLVALNLAATCSIFTIKTNIWSIRFDWTGLVAAMLFAIVLIIQIDRNIQKPEQAWYDGRAVAESVKTLAWKYAVGSRPFAIETDTSDHSGKLLTRRFHEIIEQMEDLNLADLLNDEDEYVTSSMRKLRKQTLEIRKGIYIRERILEQYSWYSGKANWNRKRINSSNLILSVTIILGFITGIIKAVSLSQLDYLALAATLIVTVFTFLHVNQHEALARAYYITSIELNTIRNNLEYVSTEDEWSRFVSEAEEAISREHTLWLASYSSELESL